MRSRQQVVRLALLFTTALVLVNVLGTRYRIRWDLTSDKRYTLSKATLEMLDELPEAVTVSAYFTEDLPPDLAVTRDEFQDLLIEYAQRSQGRVVYEFVDPNSADSLEQQALQNGIRPLLVNTREKDKAQQMKAYMGAVVRMGDQTASIPVVQRGSALEWELSSRIKQVSVTDKPTVGILQGHGEPSVNELGQFELGLSVLYNIEPMAIYDTLPIHGRFNTIVIIDPKDTIPPAQLQRLEGFMAKGHGVVLACSEVQSDLQNSPTAEIKDAGLNAWLQRFGVRFTPKVITDASCGQVQVMQRRGFFNMQTAIAFPYFPLITHFADHPASAGLDAVVFQFATPIETTGDSAYTITPLLTTSDKSNALASPVYIDIQKQWTDADFPMGEQTMGVALEGPFGGGPGAKMVVFSNGNFAVNGQGQDQLNPDNVNLLVNAVDWVTDRTGLIELRNKGVDYRPLDELSDAKRTSLKWLNLLLPIALVIGIGLVRANWRRRQRNERMTPGHVE
ncbi:MAG: Gldg family protein [Flavobacteriales bacterium]|nr:Gldg family protein [Flavobacteriales bacterium]MCB9167930.1 Gldg family protein [Flavobacteriales bacterium]